MGRVASSVDNTMVESFWSTLQRELLDTRTWRSTEQLSSAIFEWIEDEPGTWRFLGSGRSSGSKNTSRPTAPRCWP